MVRIQPRYKHSSSNKRDIKWSKRGGEKKSRIREVMAGYSDKRPRPTRGKDYQSANQTCQRPNNGRNEKKWCSIHQIDDHTLIQCREFKKLVKEEADKKTGKQVASQDRSNTRSSDSDYSKEAMGFKAGTAWSSTCSGALPPMSPRGNTRWWRAKCWPWCPSNAKQSSGPKSRYPSAKTTAPTTLLDRVIFQL